MLHTDTFNKNNWVKMTRSDYVKNTKIDGIPSEVIEVCSPISQTWKAYIYDNVTFTEFIFVDEDKDVEKSRPKEACTYPGSSTSLSAKPATSANLKALISASKVNPYQLISDGLTDELSPNIESLIPTKEIFGDLIKERDRASAKAPKSGGNKTNEMVRIIKEQALKFEEERHWLTSKLVNLHQVIKS
ncbi:hypothetical protein PPACK8108_LOCUS4400 [Phakopsora pachyrhizi]|uniref:Uncharacterized protein n=1 Tax=Phakopsora pachyrhizi TaxID=170000 RepID=A0AAV0AQS6_PHAPC|nr:hypothetical protein PPACK8108_LOCUS4400 [Phakopsora pachyrhizi]